MDDHESVTVKSEETGIPLSWANIPCPVTDEVPMPVTDEVHMPVTAATLDVQADHESQIERFEPGNVSVETYNGDPLKNFSLHVFHPETVPQSLLQNHQVVKTHISQTTCSYLAPWQFSSDLDLLDLRFCAAYAEKLQGEYEFLGRLLSDVFKTTPIQDVKSIKKLRLPQIELQPQATYLNSSKAMPPHLQIEEALRALAEAKCITEHYVLPIKCALQRSDVPRIDFKALAAFFLKFPQNTQAQEGEPGSTSAVRVSLACIARDTEAAVIKDVKRKLNDELKKCPGQNVKISYNGNKEECTVPTHPNFEPRKKSTVVEIHPLQLYCKPSTSALPTGENGHDLAKGKTGNTPAKRVSREETLKQMVTTDCVWSETADTLSRLQFMPSQHWNLEQVHRSGTDGSGTVIAVVGSGINLAHRAFQNNKISLVKNFVPNEADNFNCIVDSDGHGTLCAGIAAGNSFTTTCSASPLGSSPQGINVPCGVAPGAKLIVCNVVKEGDTVATPKIIATALQWLVEYCDQGYRVDVVSLSCGTTTYPDEISRAISDVVRAGVIVVCAAYNDGRIRLQPISFPARLGHVLCIGAQDDHSKPTSFSPVGREIDFLAPGYQIIGPCPGTQGVVETKCGSGTCFAAPAVAGLVCLALHHISRTCSQPTADGRSLLDCVRNVWVMREILKEMSTTPGHHTEELGYGTLIPTRLFQRHGLEMRRLICEIIGAEDAIPGAKRKKIN